MLRLLFLSPAYPPFPGGGERYVQSLAHALSRRGHQVTVITSAAAAEADYWQQSRPQPPVASADGPVIVVRCPLRPAAGGWAALAARRRLMLGLSWLPFVSLAWLRRLASAFPPMVGLEAALAQTPPPDLIHAFNLSWEYPALAGWRYAQAHNLPFLLTPFAHIGLGNDASAARTVTMHHQRRLLADAEAVLPLTELAADALPQHGIHCRRLAVLGAGVDPNPAADLQLLARFQLSPPFALFIGRANADKGALDAARAVLRLRQQGITISLVLAGSATPEFERFYARLSPLEQAAIRHIGPISEVEKHALLAACALLLLPSRTDALGLVLLEAWQHARPVIGARAGGIPGVIDDAVNGVLVAYGDVPALAEAVAYLLRHPEQAAAMGRAGQQKVAAAYTWEQVADRAEAVYHAVCPFPHAAAAHA